MLDIRTNRLTRVAGSAQVPEIDAASWSPDGKRLVFSAYRQNLHGGLYVVDVATKRLTPLLVRGAGARVVAGWPLDRVRARERPVELDLAARSPQQPRAPPNAGRD